MNKKIMLTVFYQLTKQGVALMDKRDSNIRDCFISSYLDCFTIISAVVMFHTYLTALNSFLAVKCPYRQLMYSQLIMITL